MSTYAPYPISGFLPQPYISTLARSTGFCPSISVSSALTTASYSPIRKRQWIPAITVEDTSLDVTLDDSIILSNSLQNTPAKKPNVRSTSLSGSPILSWLDEQTLTNTPRTLLPKEKVFSSTPKDYHALRGSIPSPVTPFLPDENAPPIILLEDSRDEGDIFTPSSSEAKSTKLHELIKESSSYCIQTVRSTPRRVPKLRRSNGNDDLRTLYHHEGPRTSSDFQELSFEEQLTLAILAEMDRSPNRFLAHRREPADKTKLELGRSTSLLSTLGKLLRTVRTPAPRIW
ncbi:hypothetical protein BDY19DRAFT_949950 [Irpex rosettiformis]|uniref:Uncharacterized protein n=1 Tax=Irpex rosettiformis TaxID=378272 RepID=A0ACB8U1Q9_9APHY|nr:hypothetical protein BDY19DRAFT_949950 [Irpex rosettiformis]